MSGAGAAQVLQEEGQVLFLVAWQIGRPGFEAPEFRVWDRLRTVATIAWPAASSSARTWIDVPPSARPVSRRSAAAEGRPLVQTSGREELAELIGRSDEH